MRKPEFSDFWGAPKTDNAVNDYVNALEKYVDALEEYIEYILQKR